MSTSTVTRVLAFGVHPRTSARVVFVGLAIAMLAVALRFLAPISSYGFELLVVVTAVGFFLAVAAGRGGGGVLAAILAATLPVFALNAALTAVAEPVTVTFIVRAASAAAWYSLGVAGLVAGPVGYAVGATTRFGAEPLDELVHVGRSGHDTVSVPRFPTADVRVHLRVDSAHYGPLFVWSLVATGVVILWLLLPIDATLSSVAVVPVLLAGGLVTASFLGYRARGVPVAVVAGGVGGGAGAELFVTGFSAAAGHGSAFVPSIAPILAGFALGVPFGVVGYAIGRVLEAANRHRGEPSRT